MKTRPLPFIYVLIPMFLLFATTAVNRGQAQEGQQNPTPIVISLTPPGTPVSDPTATPEGGLAPDRFEPNDEAGTATSIGFQSEKGLTLIGDDVDAFSGFLKAGQILQVSTTVYGRLDTRLRLTWEGQMVAENDDRSPVDLGSAVTFAAPADGWYVAFVTKAHGTLADGVYDLQTALVAPTATPTPLPTLTPTLLPTLTPLPTPTMMPSPTPLIQPDAAESNNSAGPPRPIVMPSATATATVTATAILTATERLSLTVRHLGRVEPQSEAAETTVRLLVYYDANNDRAPGPNEGIPNVGVLAVDALGQRLAQVFTNAQGEATFNLRGRAAGAVARIIVPFVPAWSARVQAGAADNELVLGLPAVRLPVFFPVAPPETGESE